MSVALYRKYRSKSLSEIVGQGHITDVLSRAIAANNTGHAYLLTGPRGTGKTSTARILAHEINQLPYIEEDEHLDIIEIDAASNNGVDDVRDLREKALIAPVAAAKKIYIIDEVHMLSRQAFNALLKILEEPPAHVVFILATTDFDKVPDTIASRTQRFHFHFIDTATVAEHLAFIAQKEGIAIEKSALETIAVRGGGSFRDSISLLDQLQHISDKNITEELVERTLGLASRADIAAMLSGINSGEAEAIVTSLQAIEKKGVSAPTLASQLQGEIRQQIATNPRLVHYLEGLASVAKSAHPDIALLVALLEHVSAPTPLVAQPTPQAPATKPKTVAQTATVTPKIHAPASTPTPNNVARPAAQKTSTPPQVAPAPVAEAPAQTLAPTAKNGTPLPPDEFDWSAVLAKAASDKDKSIGVYSLLTKCTHAFDGHTLTLYAGNKFSKDKLDSAKNQAILAQVLRDLYERDIEISTQPTTAPPKDEQAAKIAAMMGGGEEVNV